MSDRTIWYLDSSVAVRILLGHSRSAIEWYRHRTAAGDAFVSSLITQLEITRVLRREGIEIARATDFAEGLTLLSVDNSLISEATAIRPHIKSLDALHLASALRIGAGHCTVVTHDGTMAKVAVELGFDIHDPVQ